MKDSSFSAKNWLINNIPGPSTEADSLEEPKHAVNASGPTPVPSIQSGQFLVSDHIIPKWRGESLLTKGSMKFKKIVFELFNEAKTQVKSFKHRNRSLKQSLFQEFIEYTTHNGIHPEGVSDFNQFWAQLDDKNGPSYECIQDFLKVYCLRSISVYILKVRFLTQLSSFYSKTLTKNEILNPNSTLSKIFKVSSSRELSSRALGTNEYSWFRPNENFGDSILELSSILKDLNPIEFFKVLNHEIPNELSVVLFHNETDKYSHAFSNRNFGLMTNNLLINFPKWIENHGGYFNFNTQPQCLSTLFTGNFLNSLTISHWIAQENNSTEAWQEIICPEFRGDNYVNGQYLKIFQEIQFMTFLVYLAPRQNKDPISLIVSLFKQKSNKSRITASGQFALLDATEVQQSIYDRILVNLVNIPKKNPHHYLITNIMQNGEHLSNSGYMYVFSNQKLFVPSHAAKNEALFKQYKLLMRFNLEGLKGKGEIPRYFYIFSKRVVENKLDIFGNPDVNSTLLKESCLSVNMNGDLTHFSKFDFFVEEIDKLFANKKAIDAPLFSNETKCGLSFEFHQDAILNGKLLSNNSESDKITHPQYFRNLTKSCIPFDQFFSVESLSNYREDDNYDLLGFNLNPQERYPYLLIVDFTNENDIKLELTTIDSLKAKIEEYGNAYFQYFGLLPKISNLNINLFREFFKTTIGKQITQLTFNGGLKKTKAKLNAMLIPKFLEKTEFLPSHHIESLQDITLSKEDVQTTDFCMYTQKLASKIDTINLLAKRWPWHTSCILSHLKIIIGNYRDQVNSGKVQMKYDYSSSALIGKIVGLPKTPIYPNNQDIYLETLITERNDIHLPLTSAIFEKSEHTTKLRLISNDREVLNLHGELQLLQFIQFILTSAVGTPISTIVQSLEVPAAKELNSLLAEQDQVAHNVNETFALINNTLNNIIIGQINN
ncbi:hypothetical protein ABMA70_05790 [Halobacteriovorax sp. XZX-3]|uniref:hypothetical protein n=1 Tax=unclassified Halobacteriovorax TaxID=2639665 RepID=UPI000CD06883|nr:hypothetical protein [Halobacteriovorax sp. DA5]POB14995.1 hypothetical protein C0Z22_01055 [Halobacteriovorax sp. DA5]